MNNVKTITGIVQYHMNAVEKIFNIFNAVGKIISKISDKMLSDLQYFAPDLWKEIDDFRAKKFSENFTRIFEQGKKEGYFRDIRTDIIIAAFIAAMRAVVNPAFAINSNSTLKESLDIIIEILMNGIMTEKGRKIFNKLKHGVIQ